MITGNFPKAVKIKAMINLDGAAQAAFMACGLVMLGLIFLTIGALGARTGRASLRWQKTPGQVLDSQIAWDALIGKNIARVRYSYTIGGRDYESTRVSYRQGPLFGGPQTELAQAEASRYQPGQAVSVYYDPLNPDRAVLEPGASSLGLVPFGVGGLFFVLGLIAGIAALFSVR